MSELVHGPIGLVPRQSQSALPVEAMAFLISKQAISTRETYRRSVQLWFDWCRDTSLDWHGVAQVHVDVWREHLVASGLSNATVANRLSAVSAMYQYLVRQGVVAMNPAAEVERPVVNSDESDTPALDDHEAASLMAVAMLPCESLRTRVAIGILLTTGLRISELVKARLEDLGLVNGQRVIRVTRKGGKQQRIALAPQVWHDIQLMVAGRTEGPLLLTSSGKACDRQYVHGLVKRLARKADIPEETAEKCGPHALRRTAATILLDAEAPLDDVRDLLGHADARTTQGYNRSRKRLAKQAKHVTTLAASVYPELDPEPEEVA